jgi:hypothetical protein
MDQNKIRHDPRHLWVPSGASKMIAEPMVQSAQTMHLSCVKISTVSKRTETSFHFSLITSECHRVHPKWLLSMWHIWCKPCTYLALTLTLTLFPNRPKWDLTWPTSSRGSIGCVQSDFCALVCSAQTVHLSCIKISTMFKRTKTSFHLSLVT